MEIVLCAASTMCSTYNQRHNQELEKRGLMILFPTPHNNTFKLYNTGCFTQENTLGYCKYISCFFFKFKF